MNRGRQGRPHPYLDNSESDILSGFRLSILQQLNLQAHNLTQLIQLEHAP